MEEISIRVMSGQIILLDQSDAHYTCVIHWNYLIKFNVPSDFLVTCEQEELRLKLPNYYDLRCLLKMN